MRLLFLLFIIGLAVTAFQQRQKPDQWTVIGEHPHPYGPNNSITVSKKVAGKTDSSFIVQFIFAGTKFPTKGTVITFTPDRKYFTTKDTSYSVVNMFH